MAFDEKRQFTRVPFAMRVRIGTGTAVVNSKDVRNVSLGGLFVATEEKLPVGSQCIIDLELSGPASRLEIQVEAEVLRLDPEGVALKFSHIDLDSLVHLRHIIRIQAQDPEKIDSEYFKELLET
jgi:Tfp pilus assembly protein PilZ